MDSNISQETNEVESSKLRDTTEERKSQYPKEKTDSNTSQETSEVESSKLRDTMEETESKSQDPNEQGKDDIISLSEQVEDSESQDLLEEIEDGTKTFLESSELQDEKEYSISYPSSSWGKASSDWKDDISSFLTSETSTTPLSSITLHSTKIKDSTMAAWVESQMAEPEFQSEFEEEIPLSLGKKNHIQWMDEGLCYPLPLRKLSFHTCCGCSATERLINLSPLHLPKAPSRRGIVWKQLDKKFRRYEIPSPERLLKQKLAKREKGYKPQISRSFSPTSPVESIRRSKALYNLYTTFYDEGEQFNPCLTHGVKGLSRACTIFSAIKKGRINTKNLLLTLHTLGILMTRTQMLQALKYIPIDDDGNMDFYDFLEAASDILPYTDTKAFRNAQRVFKTIKNNMVAIEELEPVLASLGVTLSPKVLQHTLECTRITWNRKLNISDFLSAVRVSLYPHMNEYAILERETYQDFANISDFEYEWRRKWSLLSKGIPTGCAHLIEFYDSDEEVTMAELQEKATKSQKLRNPKSATPVEEKDKTDEGIGWPKIRPKFGYTSKDTLFPISSSLSFSKIITHQVEQKWPLTKDQEVPGQESLKLPKKKLKKHLFFQENLPTKSSPDNMQETDSKEPESEDKEDSEDLSVQQALQNVFNIIQMLAGDTVNTHDLYSALNKIGVNMRDAEFQEMLLKADVAITEDGTVKFNSFISAMGKTQLLTDLQTLKGVIEAINKIEGDKMVLHEIPSFVRIMGIHLNEKEFQEAINQISVDSNGKIVMKDFIETLTNTPKYKELSELKDTIKEVGNIQENKISLQNLKHTLQKLGIHLYPQEFEELIRMIPADREGKIDIGQVIGKISKVQRLSEIEALNNAIAIFSQLKEQNLNVSDVENCLNNIGLHLTKSELMHATKSLSVSPNETVDVKELISAVKNTGRFQNYSALFESILALKFIREHQTIQLELGKSLRPIDLLVAKKVISQVLKSVEMTEAGQADFNHFLRTLTKNQQFKASAALEEGLDILAKMENERIGFEELQVLMKSFSISLPLEEMSEALAFCNIDDNQTVNLKEFVRSLSYTNTFVINPELQLTCMVLNKLVDGCFDLQDVQSSLNIMELFKASELLEEVMQIAQVEENGKVKFKEFIRVLTVIPEVLEATVLNDTFAAMSNIRDNNVQVNDLAKTLASMGLSLTPEEIQLLQNSVTVDGDGTVNFNDIIMKIIGVQSFEEFNALQNAFRTILNILKENMKKEDLLAALENVGNWLLPEELQAVLALTPIDESGKVDGAEFLRNLVNAPHCSDFKALQDATKAIENIRDEKMTAEELEDTLENMEVHLPHSTFNEIVQAVTHDENGKIDFKEFLLALGETKDFNEVKVLQHTINVIGTMQGNQLHANKLQDTLDKLGLHLEPENIQETLYDVHVDEDGTVNLEDFLNTLRKNQLFRESLALHSAIKAFSKIKDGTIDPGELESIVDSLGIKLDSTEFQKALKNISERQTGKVNFKDFLVNMAGSEHFSESSAVHNVYQIINSMERGKIEVSLLKDTPAAFGIALSKEEVEEVLKNMRVDSDGKVILKEFMKILTCTQRFSMAEGMEEAMKTLKSIKEDKIKFEQLDSIMRAMDLQLPQDEIQKALKYVTTNVDGTLSLKDFMFGLTKTQRFSKAERNRIPIQNLNSVLENMGIRLTEEEMKNTLQQVKVDEDKKVSLDEFMMSLRSMQQVPQPEGDKGEVVAVESVDSFLSNMGIPLTKEQLQEALRNESLDGDRVQVHNLHSALTNKGIYLTDDEIVEALKSAIPDVDGTVNLNDFMNGVKNMTLSRSAGGKMIEPGELSSSLTRMGLSLTQEEIQEALKPITLDANGRVDLKNVLESIMLMQRPSKLERDKVDIQDLGSILDSAGIQLTEEKFQEVLANTSIDIKGKVNLGEFMKSVRAVQPQLQLEERIAIKKEIEAAQEEEEKIAQGQKKKKVSIVDKKVTADQEEKVAIEALGPILANKGISLSDEELQEDLMGAEDKVGLEKPKREKITQAIPQIIVNGWTKEKKVDIDSLESVLDEVGIHLTNKQLYEALKLAPMDADGMVDMEAFMRGVEAILKNQQNGKRVDVNTLDSILADMGLYLTQEEMLGALKRTALSRDGTVDLKDFMWAVEGLSSIQEKQVDVCNLDAILENMGIFLTPEDQQDLLSVTRSYDDGSVNLKGFIKACTAALALSNIEGRYPCKMPDIKTLKLPKMMEKPRPQPPSRIYSSVNFFETAKSKAVKNLTKAQLEAFHSAYDTFRKDLDGTIDLAALEATAHNLGIILTEEEVFDELMYADIDGDGRVNFTDFLNIITDTGHFIQAVAPKKHDMDTVDARGILFFELLSKLVETSSLPRKATMTIVSYYRKKFLASTGKTAWRPGGTHEVTKQGGQKPRLSRSKSTSLSAFAGAARICIMNDKELQEYVEYMQAKATPSESPYAQVPIFPLIPKRDSLINGKPKKDLQKLEAQRRMEPISSFEDHLFHKKRWIKQEPKPTKAPKPILSLSPELSQRRLTMDDVDEIRREAKKVTGSYRKAIALRERNKSLKLWRRIRGGEIGLDTDNPSFYQTFSTYSWSWNVCQDMLTPRELQEYDNKLYHGIIRPSSPLDKLSSSSGKQKGSKK